MSEYNRDQTLADFEVVRAMGKDLFGMSLLEAEDYFRSKGYPEEETSRYVRAAAALTIAACEWEVLGIETLEEVEQNPSFIDQSWEEFNGS